ncbi:MAG TPA: hypothetical protein VLQ65_16425, partial [Saliniramus sp.]|nr:hypothetical protein [Saliniramus sp.]
ACDMRHESRVSEAGAHARPPLCPSRARMGNIACSHTSARLLMRDAWLLLEEIGQPDAAMQREELARIDYESSVLDYRRYDADTEGRADLVASQIAEHRALGEEVEALRKAALVALDRAAADQLKIAS